MIFLAQGFTETYNIKPQLLRNLLLFINSVKHDFVPENYDLVIHFIRYTGKKEPLFNNEKKCNDHDQ
jgi:hypothetical protein